MKLFPILLAILLVVGWITPGKAQLIQSGSFDNTGTISFTVTFTQAEPVNIIASSIGHITEGPGTVPSGDIEIDVDGNTVRTFPAIVILENQSVHTANYALILAANYTANPVLAAGQHTITVIANGGEEGGATLIAPNESTSGASDAISTIENNISTLQTDEASDANLIATLQANQLNQAGQISTLVANEQADAANIAGLQNQLTTIQNTLQGEINGNTSAITALQNRATADEATLAQQQAEITALQNLPNDSSAIATLQQEQAAISAQQQADETTLAQHQAEITALQNAPGDNASAIAALQQEQAATTAQLQTDEINSAQQQAEITALQNAGGNTASAIATLQQQQAATTALQQTDEANLAALQSQETATETVVDNLKTDLASFEASQAQENAKLESENVTLQNEIAALQGILSPLPQNSPNKSNGLDDALIYAGVGLGIVGVGTGIDAILSEDSNSSASPTSGTHSNH